MTIRESYVCPRCGKVGNITSIQTLMDDVRFDVIKCSECGVEWRAYYRTSNVVTEVTYVPEETSADASEETKSTKASTSKKSDAKSE